MRWRGCGDGALLGSPSIHGLAERLMVLIVQVWLVAAAVAVIRHRRAFAPE